jgi:hypothetical protein
LRLHKRRERGGKKWKVEENEKETEWVDDERVE